MVRLVFRPYTHVRRTICTSISLRTSIRVSPAFILHKHSSPSFGSQLISSCSTFHKRSDAAGDAPVKGLSSRFLCTPWFSTIRFAHKLDSLVRVSRRVGTVRKSLFLGAHSHRHPNRQANPASGDPRKTNPPEQQRKNPSRYLTPSNSIKGGIRRPQKANFPPAPSFGAARSQQADPEQLEQASK
jgi:hypothetical protein